MSWLIQLITGRDESTPIVDRFVPQPPPGFVKRSDPNFYFLARKF